MFLGEHDYFDKRWIYEECLQMPFLARLPGVIPAGAVNDAQLCSNLDFRADIPRLSQKPATESEISKMQGTKPAYDSQRAMNAQLNGVMQSIIAIGCIWLIINIPGHYGVRTDRYKLAFFYGLPLDAKSWEKVILNRPLPDGNCTISSSIPRKPTMSTIQSRICLDHVRSA